MQSRFSPVRDYCAREDELCYRAASPRLDLNVQLGERTRDSSDTGPAVSVMHDVQLRLMSNAGVAWLSRSRQLYAQLGIRCLLSAPFRSTVLWFQ
jgi:hypothetical protein